MFGPNVVVQGQYLAVQLVSVQDYFNICDLGDMISGASPPR